MASARTSGSRKLRGLGNISWLTSRQLDKLAGALTVTSVERRGVISEERNSPELAYVLLTGVARITCINRKGLRSQFYSRGIAVWQHGASALGI